MNWDTIEGKWRELNASLKQRWAELTDDEIAQLSGKREELAGALQSKYGKSREAIDREIDDWAENL